MIDLLEIIDRKQLTKELKCSPGKVDELTQAEILPHFKVGNMNRYRMKDIHRVIDRVTRGIK